MKTLGEKLKELRLAKGVTLQSVASAVGITRSAVANYEANTREPSLDTLKKFCDYFDVSADYLLGLSEY